MSLIVEADSGGEPKAAPASGRDGYEDDEKFFLDWPAWAGRFLKFYFFSVRVRTFHKPDLDELGPIIIAFWHGDDLCLLPTQPWLRANVLVSQSRDGSMLSRAFRVLGHQARRGSSSKGGAEGLIALKKGLERGVNAAFAADGPRGPREIAKPGPVYLAAKTGCPILPLGAAADRAYIFKKSWNKTRLPLPASRLAIAYGRPLYFPKEASRWPAYQQSRLLTAAIFEANHLAEEELRSWTGRRS